MTLNLLSARSDSSSSDSKDTNIRCRQLEKKYILCIKTTQSPWRQEYYALMEFWNSIYFITTPQIQLRSCAMLKQYTCCCQLIVLSLHSVRNEDRNIKKNKKKKLSTDNIVFYKRKLLQNVNWLRHSWQKNLLFKIFIKTM